MFIKRSNVIQLLKYKKACERIFRLMTEPIEDEHGNVSAYRYDRVHKDILNTLAGVGLTDWKYDIPWKVAK